MRKIKHIKGVTEVHPKDVGLGSSAYSLSRLFMLDDGRILNVMIMITGPNGETDCEVSEIVFEEGNVKAEV